MATTPSSTALIHPPAANNDAASTYNDHDDDEHDSENASPFIRKTYQLVSEAPTGPNATVQWDDSGLFFIVRNQNDFTQNYLPRYFRHKNFASFVRQLNFYGFIKRSYQGKYIKFSHPQFQRNHPELLIQIKRKPTEQANYFKQSIDELQQKCNKLEQEYGDLQQTMKHMIYVFARYVGSHQHTPTINDIHSRMQDLQGKMSISSQMPYMFDDQQYNNNAAHSVPQQQTQHKRPRLMLEAGGNDNRRQQQSVVYSSTHQQSATAPSNTNLEDDLWQQILSLTERMSNMPNGAQQQSATANHKASNQVSHPPASNNKPTRGGRKSSLNGMQPPANVGNRSSTATVEQVNSDEDNSMYDYDGNAQAEQYTVPSNIELIDDDEIASTASTGSRSSNSNAGFATGPANKKSPGRRRGGATAAQSEQRGVRSRSGGAYIEPATDSSNSHPGTPTPLDDAGIPQASFNRPPSIPHTPTSATYPTNAAEYFTGNNGSYPALPSPQLTPYSAAGSQSGTFGSGYSPQHPSSMDASFSPLHPSSFSDDTFANADINNHASNSSQIALPPLPPINSLDDTYAFPPQQRQNSATNNFQYTRS